MKSNEMSLINRWVPYYDAVNMLWCLTGLLAFQHFSREKIVIIGD